MNFLKKKEQVISDRLNSIHESVFKMGDLYKVRTNIDVPKSLINAFVSKAKKEHGMDPRENWSDTELAEMFISYITANFINIESLPVDAILGEKTENPNEMSTEITSEENFEETPNDSIETSNELDNMNSNENTPSGEIEM